MFLPDGNTVEIEDAFFTSIETKILHESVQSIIQAQNGSFEGLAEYINPNLFFQGGLTHFDAFEVQVKDILNADTKQSKLRTADERQYSSWLGGSIYASLKLPSSFWISKNDYREYGKNILFRKILN